MAYIHRWILPIVIFMIIVSFSSTQAGMDITAYEYQRKFQKTLSLGECPFRQVAVKMVNDTINVQDERCTLQKKGTVRSLPRALSDTRNELITSPDEVVKYLGLCGGEAASYLGILHDGECVAVEIASRLTFSHRTVVRAFIGYYRTALDILDTTEENIRDGMEPYYKNKYYVKNRSYGTLEIIFVQLRFWNESASERAGEYKQADPKMSSYMEGIKNLVGEPKSVKIISLSTASEDDYKIETKQEWNRALRYVQIVELKINHTRDLIKNNLIAAPHLKYELFPFNSDDFKSAPRFAPIAWKKTSMMEVQLRQAMLLVKKMNKKCKKNKSKVCRRVRQLRRTLKSQQAEIHKGRSAWMNLTTDEKTNFVKRYSSQVDSFSRLAKRLNKDVREMIRKRKLEKLNRKRNKHYNLNEIPTSISSNRQHRIRHLRRKLSRRKNRRSKAKKNSKPRYRNMGWF